MKRKNLLSLSGQGKQLPNCLVGTQMLHYPTYLYEHFKDAFRPSQCKMFCQRAIIQKKVSIMSFGGA